MIPRNSPVIEHERHMMSGHETVAHGTDHLSDIMSGVNANVFAVQSGNWSAASTWSGGAVPVAGQHVHIPTGRRVTYNQVSDVILGWVRVDGALKFSTTAATKIVCDTILCTAGSYLEIGNPVNPATAEIVFKAGPLFDLGGHEMSRGLITMGRVMIVGRELVPFAKLPNAMPAGTQAWTVPDTRDPVTDDVVWTGAEIAASWQVGDTLYFPKSHISFPTGNDKHTIAAINGATITLNSSTQFRHNGAVGDPHGVGEGNRIDPTGAMHRHQSYAINETRSIVFRSMNKLPITERAHIMFGHSRRLLATDMHLRKEDHIFTPTWDELGADADPGVYLSGFAVVDMGRTETKADPKIGQPGNKVGRYPVHLHRTGHWAQRPVTARLIQVIGNVGWAFVRHDCHVEVDLCAARGDNSEGGGINGGGALFMDEEDTEFGAWTRCIGYSCRGRSDKPVNGPTDFNNEGSFNGHGHEGDAFAINRLSSCRWLVGIDVENILHIHPPKTNTRNGADSTVTTGYPVDRKPDWEGIKRTSFLGSPVAGMWRDDPNPGGWFGVEGFNYKTGLRVFHRQRAFTGMDYHTMIQGWTLTGPTNRDISLENYILNYMIFGCSFFRLDDGAVAGQWMLYGDKSWGLVVTKNLIENFGSSIGFFAELGKVKNLAGGFCDNSFVNGTTGPRSDTGADLNNYSSAGAPAYTFGATFTNAPFGGQSDKIELWITDGFTGLVPSYKASSYTPPVSFDPLGPRPGGASLRGDNEFNIHIPVNRPGFETDHQLSLSDRELVMHHGCIVGGQGHVVPLYFPYRDRLTAELAFFRTEYDVTHLPLEFREKYLMSQDPGAPSTANILPTYPARKTATTYAVHMHPTKPIMFVITDGILHIDAVEAYLDLPVGQTATETVTFTLADGSTIKRTFDVPGKAHAPSMVYAAPELTRGGDFITLQGQGPDEFAPNIMYLGKGKTNGWPLPWVDAEVLRSTDAKATWVSHPDDIGIHDNLLTSVKTWTNSGGRRPDGPFNIGPGHYRLEVTHRNSLGSVVIPSNTMQIDTSNAGLTYGTVWDVTAPVLVPEPAPPAPVTIDYSAGPSGTLGPVAEGDSVSAILAALNPGNPIASDGGTVTITRALYTAEGQITGTVVGGTVLTEAIFTGTAEGAAPVSATLALGVTVEAPVAPNPPATATIEHMGATFTVTNVVNQGTFADGDPWVVVADGGQITQVAPVSTVVASRTIASSEGGGVATNTVVHGMQRNPGNAAEVYSNVGTLAQKQVKNFYTGGGNSYGTHGYDGSHLWSINPTYDPALNLDPGRTGQPLAANVGTYVKAISPLSDLQKRPTLQSFGVLHVLPSVPPSDALAPPIQTADKTIRVRKSEIDPAIFNNYSVTASAIPTATEMLHLLDWAHTYQKTYGTNTENIVPVPTPNTYGHEGFKVSSYMGTTHQCFAQAMLALETNRWTLAEKHDIATLLVAHAVDLVGRALEGGIIQDNGGWAAGGTLTAWAAKITGNKWLHDGSRLRAEADVGYAGKLTKVGESVWGDWKQYRYIGQTEIDADHRIYPVISGVTYTDEYFFTQQMLGWPEWNGDATRNRQLHNSLGAQGAWPESYRDICTKASVPGVLALRLRGVGRTDVPDAKPAFDYVDRHMQWLLGTDAYEGIDLSLVVVRSPNARPNPRTNSSNPIASFVKTLWSAYRGTNELWNTSGSNIVAPTPAGTGTLVTAVIGQSENEVAWAINTQFYTAGPYPTLLSGVNAQIALQAASDKSGQNTVRTLNAAAVTAKDVSPGFVALANLWHVGSGGRPLRLVDVVVPGTSANDMFDTENTKRDTAADISIINFAATAFGPVQRVTYHWSNSEASASKTLRVSRSPHLIGRNSDGTPYAFTQPGIDYCAIDTTGGTRGMFPTTAKLDLMHQIITIENSNDLIDPPHRNYRYKADGTDTHGRINQNGTPVIAERKAFVASIPAANRGVTTITSAPVRFGDYVGGVKNTGSSQTNIHPAQQSLDGQALFAQHTAASFLIAEGHLKVSRYLRAEVAGDGSVVDLIFEMANGGTLSTMRKQGRGSTITTPRPHQHADGMGFVIYRTGDDKRTGKPLFRSTVTSATLYPEKYRGTVQIVDAGTLRNGVKEARVRVTPVVPFVNGETVLFGDDGGYGGFILSGYPDYDAQLYLDCLIEHIPALAAANYPGLPIEPQVEVTLSGITGAGGGSLPTPTPTEPPPQDATNGEGVEMFDFAQPWATNSTGLVRTGTATFTGRAKTTGAGLRLTWATTAPQDLNRKNVRARATVTVSQQVVFGMKLSAVPFLTSQTTKYEVTLTPTTLGVPQTFEVKGLVVDPLADDYGGFQFYATTTECDIKIELAGLTDLDGVADTAPNAPANPFFVTSGTGPVFLAAANAPTGKSKASLTAKFRISAGAVFTNGQHRLGSLGGTDFEVALVETGGVIDIKLLALRDTNTDPAGGSMLTNVTLMANVPRGQMIEFTTIADHTLRQITTYATGRATITNAYGKPSTGFFRSDRKFANLGTTATTNLLPAGVEIEYVGYFLDGESYMLASGTADQANANPLKVGGNAVATSPIAPAPTAQYFTTVAGGPVLKDPAAVPSGTKRIRHKFKVRVAPTYSGIGYLWHIDSQGFSGRLLGNNGATQVELLKIEDSTGADLTPTTGRRVLTGERNIWYTLEVYADIVDRKWGHRLGTEPFNLYDFSVPGNGTFSTIRELAWFGWEDNTGHLGAGVDIEYWETYLTPASGAEVLHKRIDASTVNTDPWKLAASGSATITA